MFLDHNQELNVFPGFILGRISNGHYGAAQAINTFPKGAFCP